MKRLLIIGNGFDLSHTLLSNKSINIPSSYNDFKKYLTKTYEIETAPYPYISSDIGNHGEVIVSPKDSASLLIYGMNTTYDYEKWSDFEEDLPEMDFSWLTPSIEDYTDKEGDINPFYFEPIYNSFINDFSNVIYKWKSLLEEWIIEVNCEIIDNYEKYIINQKIIRLLDDETIVLSFNYTETIEYLYHFHNTIHIHNKVGDKELIWGHGDEKIDINSVDDFDYTLCNSIVINNYKKNVEKQISKYKYFFDMLEGQQLEIFSFGFGYGYSDLPYIKEIITKISSKSIWFVNDYDYCYNKQEKIIKKLGFKGKIVKWNGNI
ncbi:MAG: bacteriophage abortive infection AbiH family protein [bacterium]|nr:bacteriophage abortive infection AbiH family protein [bacterium]